MTNFVRRFASDDSGATAIEYGLIAGLIALVLVAALQLMGPKIGNALNAAGNGMP